MSEDRVRFNRKAAASFRHVLQAHERSLAAGRANDHSAIYSAGVTLDAAIMEFVDTLFDAIRPTDEDAVAA